MININKIEEKDSNEEIEGNIAVYPGFANRCPKNKSNWTVYE